MLTHSRWRIDPDFSTVTRSQGQSPNLQPTIIGRLGKHKIVSTGQTVLECTAYHCVANDPLQTCILLGYCRSSAGLSHHEAPALCTTDVTIALPNQERLWQATVARSWDKLIYNMSNTPPSLHSGLSPAMRTLLLPSRSPCSRSTP
jgi:hypothetical protein